MHERYVSAITLGRQPAGARYEVDGTTWIKQQQGTWTHSSNPDITVGTHRLKLIGVLSPPALPSSKTVTMTPLADASSSQVAPPSETHDARGDDPATGSLTDLDHESAGGCERAGVAAGRPADLGLPVPTAVGGAEVAKGAEDSFDPRRFVVADRSPTPGLSRAPASPTEPPPAPPQAEEWPQARQASRQATSARRVAGVLLSLSITTTIAVVSPITPMEIRTGLLWTLAFALLLQAFALQGRAEALLNSLGHKPRLYPSPGRPEGLDPPSFRAPKAPTVPLHLPPAPPSTLRGRWTHCRECGRPLTDPLSRRRGVGPSCFARTGAYYPQGPRNPAYQAWQSLVESMTQEHAEDLKKAMDLHAVAVADARREHASAHLRWEADVATRSRIQLEHDAARAAWHQDDAQRRQALRQWSEDPRHAAASLCNHLSTATFLFIPLLPIFNLLAWVSSSSWDA